MKNKSVATTDNKTISNLNLIDLGQYLLFDEISQSSAKEACTFLLKANTLNIDTNIFINSPGGSCTAGFAIVDFMEASRVKVNTRAIGQICSMGFVIFIAGQKGNRIMSPNTTIMSHTFTGGAWGKSHELFARNEHFKELHQRIIAHYLKHTTCTKKQIKEMFLGATDLYLTPKECLKYGICDKVADPWEV